MPAYKEIASHMYDTVLQPIVKFRPWSLPRRQTAEPAPHNIEEAAWTPATERPAGISQDG